MPKSCTFALVREGSSDDGLIPHLRELLVRSGIDSVIGSARAYKGTTVERLTQVASEEAPLDLVFVHRDADGRTSDERRSEILEAGSTFASGYPLLIPVIPIQELEAWLLLDEQAIRDVVGKPSGRQELGIPKVKHIEKTHQPKEILEKACLLASNTTGRRHKEEKRKFPERRRVLLERLDIDGPVQDLSAWKAMQEDIQRAATLLAQHHK